MGKAQLYQLYLVDSVAQSQYTAKHCDVHHILSGYFVLFKSMNCPEHNVKLRVHRVKLYRPGLVGTGFVVCY